MNQLSQAILLILKLTSCLHFSAVTTYKQRTRRNTFEIDSFSQSSLYRNDVESRWKLHYTTGSAANIFDWLSKKFNFTYSISDPVIDPVMIAKYGYYDLAIDKLGKNGIDVMLSDLIVTPDRARRADFTSMVWSEPYTIVAPKPEQESRLFAFIRPFQPTVVLVIIAIMSGFSFPFKRQLKGSLVKNDQLDNAKMNCISKMEEFTNTLSYYTIYVVDILTNHGIYTPYAQHSFQILAGGWLLAALVLVNSYSSIVVSSLTVPKMKPEINTFEDLANNGEIYILLNEDVVLSKIILSASTGTFKALWSTFD